MKIINRSTNNLIISKTNLTANNLISAENRSFKRRGHLQQKVRKLRYLKSLALMTHVSWRQRLVSLMLVFSIFSSTVFASPDAARATVVTIDEYQKNIRFGMAANNFGTSFLSSIYSNVYGSFFKPLVTQQQRVERIVIFPRDEKGALTILQGGQTNFTAIGLKNEQPLSGVQFTWSVTDTLRKHPPQPLNNGIFKAEHAGIFIITASVNDLKGQITVTVMPNEGLGIQRLLQKKDSERKDIEKQGIEKMRSENKLFTRDISSRNNYNPVEENQRNQFFKQKLNEVKIKQQQNRQRKPNPFQTSETDEPKDAKPEGIDRADAEGAVDEYDLKSNETVKSSTESEKTLKEEKSAFVNSNVIKPVPYRPADEDGWDGGNWYTADDPGNQIGNPPGVSPDVAAGNGNFQLSVPIVSLPGRGMDMNLSLNYNSRLWSKSGSTMTFDADKSNPAPGWSLGFGKMIFMGANGGCMLVDADGTRRGYTGSNSTYSYSGYFSDNFTGHTTDGSFIDYTCTYVSTTYGTYFSGSAALSNGTTITYGSQSAVADQIYPTMLEDAQGNLMGINYVNYQGPQISTISDTMGRIITFNYDTLNRLVSVTVPGLNGGTPRTAIRLHYTALTLNYAFASGISTDTNTTAPYVLDSIYYPGTNTGYWFGDSDSYSSYGMIAKVKEMRGMSSTGTATDQGTVTAGTMSKQSVYDYPLTPDSSLTDAPTYSNLTESWDGIDTAPAITNYVTFMNSSPRTITVTYPSGSKSKQYMYNAPNLWNDGLTYQDETLDQSNNVLSKSEVTWQLGNYDAARPLVTIATDEQLQTLKTEFGYGTNYNQVTSKKEYDYNNGPLLRETRLTYENNAAYTNRHIFNLVKSNEIYDGAGNRVARTDYQFDNNIAYGGAWDLKDTPGVIAHDYSFDPYTTVTYQGPCINGQFNYPVCNYDGEQAEDGSITCVFECTEYAQISGYNPSTVYRGNVTKIVSYADAVNLTGIIQETRKYDETGNMISQSNSTSNPIDEEVSLNYDISTQYAYPLSQTEGSPNTSSPLRNTVSSVYDFNTGIIKQTTDKNGRISTVTFNPDNLRPTVSTSSTGSYQQTFYDDAGMSVMEEAHEYGGNLVSRTTKYLNGIGQIKREETLGISSVSDIVETKYTNFGQVWKQSRPYRTGDTIQWTENFYDIQGRVIQVTESDGSTVQAFYNESLRPGSASALPGKSVRSVDAWGRERWERYDKDNKLAEVVEPDPNGNGSVFSAGNLVTKYTVDTLGRLTATEQGSQHRYFKYDSLGQLTRQKLAEQTATINDAGQYVGAGNGTALWSEAFWYDDQTNLTAAVDARGVKTYYSYQISGAKDPLNRLQSKVYDISGPLDPGITIHAAPTITYSYMTSGDKMRLQQIRTDGILSENYSYDVEGRVSDYNQTIDSRTSYPMTTSYSYDSLDRVTDVRYPAQYGIAGNPRKLVHHSFDIASRLTNLTYDGQQQAGSIIYDASQRATSINIGAAGTNQVTEQYTYDSQNGLLTNQKAIRNGQTLMDLNYDYQRNSSNGTLSGKTGHLTKIFDNLNHNKDREYQYDAIGRLTAAKGGVSSALWQQTYSYDRYGNRTNVTAAGVAADNSAMPRDGLANMTYDAATNRVTTAGFEYDSAGNQTRALAEDGVSWLRFEYDAANRLQIVKNDAGTNQQSFQYGADNQRLMSMDYMANQLTIFASHNGTVTAEYTEFTANTPTWTKGYTYLGDKILSTISNNGSGGETVEYNHPDQLGTRLVTNQQAGTSIEQVNLPFGTALNAESSGSAARRFTSYERSNRTGLDYAQNRTYDSKQGRFTQVDPIGMSAVDLRNPQTLNLFSYCANDPINHTDADGLFFGFLKKFFNWLGQALKWIALAVAVVALVLVIVAMPAGAWGLAYFFSFLGAVASVAEQLATVFGNKVLASIFGIIGAITSFGTSLIDDSLKWAKSGMKAILGVIKAGANLASKVLTLAGYDLAGKILGFASAVAGSIKGLKYDTQKDFWGRDILDAGKKIPNWKSAWEWFKNIRGLSQQFATMVGAKKIAGILGKFGLIEDIESVTQSIGNMTRGLDKAKVHKDGGEIKDVEGKTKVKTPRWNVDWVVKWHNRVNWTKIEIENLNKAVKSLNSISQKVSAN